MTREGKWICYLANISLRIDRGTPEDAVRLLDYLVDLGVNAVELIPMSEF